MSSGRLKRARSDKRDEFYTRLADVDAELVSYREHLVGKRVLLNGGDFPGSAFRTWFMTNFDWLGIRELVSVGYDPDGGAFMERVAGWYQREQTRLEGTGDFRSPEVVELLDEADVVVTNPPFSLFREFAGQLVERGKDFVIVGPLHAATSTALFPSIRDGAVRLGVRPSKRWVFDIPKGYEKGYRLATSGNGFRVEDGRVVMSLGNACWFTTFDHGVRRSLDCTTVLSEVGHPPYDNLDAIECGRVDSIPSDWMGKMGVPITYLWHHDPAAFDILDTRCDLQVNGRAIFRRIIIQRRKT